MLRLHASNRMEALVGALAGVLRDPLPDPLEPEIIVVQNRGTERWVSMELARRFGVWMNGRFPFPNAIVEDLFERVLGPAEGAEHWEPDLLAWAVHAVLPGCLDRPAFAPLRRFLAGDALPLKRYQLARRIADLFDRYTVYRPDMVLGWEAGATPPGDAAWQAELWRALVERHGAGHRAGRLRAFRERVASAGRGLPARLCVFGVSVLPPFHLDVLGAVAARTEVHLFVLSPCREYWGDIVPDRVIARKRREGRAAAGYMETGNRLLASLGRTGREFLELLLERDVQADEAYEDPGEGCLLHALQSDILHLRDRGAGDGDQGVIRADDRSVAVASCHSPLREVEALRDHLLALFEAHPDLEPHQVVVMTPDIETYAPLVEAVLQPEEGVPRIPYNVADRSALAGSSVADAFFRVLDLVGGRLGAARVLDLLQIPVIRRRFGLSEAEVERIHAWVGGTRIRWGEDARHRERLGLPGFAENTWRAGLDRLLLGYAMPGEGERMFAGVLPFDDVEGGEDAEALGKLLAFVEAFFAAVADLEGARDLPAWARALGRMLDALFRPEGEEEREARVLRDALDRMARAGGGDRVAPEAVGAHLREAVGRAGPGGGFLTGGVTFCAMLPMRSIPFQVVCLLGMNDGAFPRPSPQPGFDLMAREPRRGDRSVRDEDRYVFLEALLSARRHLYVSYVGQSQQDNTEIPPSVLVSELLETVDRGFRLEGGGEARPSEHLVARHRLQAFSPAYFRPGGALASYSRENMEASRHLLPGAPRARRGPWVPSELPEPDDGLRGLTLVALERFFANPSRGFLEGRFGFRLEAAEGAGEEREPFDLGPLERYLLEEELLALAQAGEDPARARERLRARGELPPGAFGDAAFAELEGAVRELWGRVEPRISPPVPEPPAFELGLGPFTLVGRLEGLRTGGLLLFRPARLKGRDRLRAWLRHLVLHCLDGVDAERRTVVVAKDAEIELGPVEDPRGELRSLAERYWAGLRSPLRFFPETSWAYAWALLGKGAPRDKALSAARRAWEGSEWGAGEGTDEHYAQCFGEQPVLDGDFEEAAVGIYGPLIRCLAGRG